MADPRVDVKALADLARLEISDTEVAKLEKEIPDILKFVEQIQDVAAGVGGLASDTEAKPPTRNVMREDNPPAGGPHESGEYTERLLEAAPKSTEGMVVVKQVVSRKSAQGRSASGGK